VGVVIAVRRDYLLDADRLEVDFGYRRTLLHENQLIFAGTVGGDLSAVSSDPLDDSTIGVRNGTDTISHTGNPAPCQ
jgi:hypothetical protein